MVLFLLPAMGIVESIDHFGGFVPVMNMMTSSMFAANPTLARDKLMVSLFIITFCLSSLIDNLTATIVALKILHTVIPSSESQHRHVCGGLVVIAANAGGAWSPIGDVTTTMLWISGKISVGRTMHSLFLPSFVAGVVPLLGIRWQVRFCERRRQQRLSQREFEKSKEKVREGTDEETAELAPSTGECTSTGVSGETELATVSCSEQFALVLGRAWVLKSQSGKTGCKAHFLAVRLSHVLAGHLLQGLLPVACGGEPQKC